MLKKMLFLNLRLKKHSNLIDVLWDSPENHENHFDPNITYKPEKAAEKIWENKAFEPAKKINIEELKSNTSGKTTLENGLSSLNVYVLE